MKEQLLKLCIDIYAHCICDYEITLGCNGTNPFEAANVATEILSILNISKESIQDIINKEAKELKEWLE